MKPALALFYPSLTGALSLFLCLMTLNGSAQEPGTKLWECETTPDRFFSLSSPAIGTDGTIYSIGDSTLWAVTPSGSNKWKRADMYVGNPVLDHNQNIYGSLFSPGLAGIRAFSPANEVLWVFSENPSAAFAMAESDKGLFLTSGQSILKMDRFGNTTFLEADSGTCPTIARDGTFYYLGARSIRAINPQGILEPRYFYLGNEAITPMAIDEDGTIYCGWEAGKLCAVNPDLSRKWLFDLEIPQSATVLIAEPAIGPDGTIYFGTTRGLYAMTRLGEKKWVFPSVSVNFGAYPCSPAVARDGTVYFGVGTNFFAINPDGTEQWRFSNKGEIRSSPAISHDGTVYLGGGDSKLYALKGTAPLAETSWPMEGHDLRRSRKASCFIGSPCFDSVQKVPSAQLELNFIGKPGQEYVFQSSSDLSTWYAFTNGTSVNGSLQFLDSHTNSPQRFYRAYAP